MLCRLKGNNATPFKLLLNDLTRFDSVQLVLIFTNNPIQFKYPIQNPYTIHSLGGAALTGGWTYQLTLTECIQKRLTPLKYWLPDYCSSALFNFRTAVPWQHQFWIQHKVKLEPRLNPASNQYQTIIHNLKILTGCHYTLLLLCRALQHNVCVWLIQFTQQLAAN